MKRTFALLLAVLMCFGLFMGCSGDGDKDTASTASQGGATNGILSIDDVKFVDENGESVYCITRPDGDEETNTKAAYLFKQIKSILGVNIKNTSDANDGTDAYEILVGETNRAETAQAKTYLAESIGARYGDYIICTIGKKIVIYSRNQESLQLACEYFVTNYVKAEGVKGGIAYTHATEGNFADASINGASLGLFVFVKQRYNESYITQNQIEEANELLIDKTGYKLEIVEDHNEASEYEIIIGNANRDGVEAITNKDEYKVTVSGKKVYLNGGSPAARAMAVSEFAKMLVAGAVTDASSVSGSYAQAVAGYDASTYYTPTWTDDFDEASSTHATGIDLSKWAWGTDSSEGSNGRTSVRSQSPEHLFVGNGMLNFYAAYDDTNYYGFKLTTRNRMTFRYGILEMSAILPDSGTKSGFWISLWANSYDPESPSAFFTEVNVVEMFGNSATEASNLHGWLRSNQRAYYDSYWAPQGIADHWSLDGTYSGDKRYECPEGKFNDGLHTFTYIWDETSSSFACDGNVYFTLDHTQKELWVETFTQPIYLILSMATGFAQQASCPADDDPVWQESNNFQIDYVHIYQKNDGKHTLNYLG